MINNGKQICDVFTTGIRILFITFTQWFKFWIGVPNLWVVNISFPFEAILAFWLRFSWKAIYLWNWFGKNNIVPVPRFWPYWCGNLSRFFEPEWVSLANWFQWHSIDMIPRLYTSSALTTILITMSTLFYLVIGDTISAPQKRQWHHEITDILNLSETPSMAALVTSILQYDR